MCISNENKCGFSKQFATSINGQQTEFVFQPFANKWFLLITQYGKVPNLYSVKFDLQRNEGVPAAIQGPVEHPQFHMSVPITITCNFGADKDEIRSGIQYLVNKSKLNRCPTEFVIGLGLKEMDGKNLKAVAQVLDEIIA
ncbi:uncharacterized protein LOC119605637 [Lucilia sericata]|uniref:uncharacterized protein LOC119605637 n=1 Tax=Lucilia sericata TaxID=13632 RepID=UPI0018A86E35|nr:uncharacterized protein LOC119605637 [Lucilia sericata]